MGDVFYLELAFAEGGGGGLPDGKFGHTEFGFGDSVTYSIKGLSASSFVVATKNGKPDTYYSAAQVDDAKGGAWVGGSTITPSTGTPLPASVWGGIALVGGLAGVCALAARRHRSAAI